MNYKKLFGYGILIYVALFVYWSALIAYGAEQGIISQIVSLIIIAALACFAGHKLETKSVNKIIRYSVGWTVIVALLDVLFTVPFTGWEVFNEWSVWVGYAIILLIPLCVSQCKCKWCKIEPQQFQNQNPQTADIK